MTDCSQFAENGASRHVGLSVGHRHSTLALQEAFAESPRVTGVRLPVLGAVSKEFCSLPKRNQDSFLWSVMGGGKGKGEDNIGALIITYTILGVPCYNKTV